MTLIPLAITMACYFWVAFGFYQQGNHPLAGAFVFYAFANACFMAAAMR